MSDTIAALSGGSLPAAIGLIRLSGPDCTDLLDRFFRARSGAPAGDWQHGKMYYGELYNLENKLIDICMAALFRGPVSYTGEDMAEIYCHGSPAVASECLRSLFGAGARSAEPGEFSRRGFLNGKMDLVEAEAVIDLIDSRTAAAAENAAAQLRGAHADALEQMRAGITAQLAHFYAVCDYSDEEIDPFTAEAAANQLEAYAARLEELAAGYRRGAVLKEGLPVAILGRPNVGKSSLLNALAGYDRAIVTDEPGTTRDMVEEAITVSGGLIRIMDTAGIREAQGQAERIGVEKSLETARRAALVLWVVDGSDLLTDEDRHVAASIRDLPHALVINKDDKEDDPLGRGEAQWLAGDCPVFKIAAKTGAGVTELARWLGSQAVPQGEVLVTSQRQARLMEQAAEHLRAAVDAARMGMTADAFLSDAEQAVTCIGRITGRVASDDIAQAIFSRFCVGK